MPTISVGTTPVKLIENVLSYRQVTVNPAAACTISKDPNVTVGGLTSFAVAAAANQIVGLAPGQAVYAVVATGTTTVSII
jgi:hypothetical protein